MHAYSYDVDTTMMGIHVTSTNKIFINASGQIVHAESDGEAMGTQVAHDAGRPLRRQHQGDRAALRAS